MFTLEQMESSVCEAFKTAEAMSSTELPPYPFIVATAMKKLDIMPKEFDAAVDLINGYVKLFYADKIALL